MKFLQKLSLLLLFGLIFLGVILYAKGYRINFSAKKLEPTGIIAITAFPKASSVYLNGKLVGATDLNLNLKPGEWEVEVKKEGYTSWKKKVNLKEGVVINLDARLFPINPTLKPLTSIGVSKAEKIDNLDKILLFVKKGKKEEDGVYLLEKGKGPIASKPKPKLLLLFSEFTNQQVEVEKLNPIFSPDFQQFIIDLSGEKYLFSLKTSKQEPLIITNSYESLVSAWEKEKEQQIQEILKSFSQDFEKIATASFEIKAFSPDQTKLLYKAKKSFKLPYFAKKRMKGVNPTPETRELKKGSLYVYDKKEDRNYYLPLPKNSAPLWYIDSKRLIFVKGNSIDVVDYDGENKQVLYAGPFEKNFLTITSDGNLLVLINFNKELNPYPEVYELIINE